jgi:hypothetical protein
VTFDSAVLSSPVAEPETEISSGEHPQTHGPLIRCPLCGWSPAKNDLWSCTCGHSWNTFDTGGVCPACLYQWTETQCLKCGKWSPHSDWYVDAA